MTQEFLLKCLALCTAPIVLECVREASVKVDLIEAKALCTQDFLDAIAEAREAGTIKTTFDPKQRVDIITRVP